MSTVDRSQEITVVLPGMERDAIYVESAEGFEALGQAYEFRIDVLSRDPLTLEPMLGGAAALKMRVLDEEAVVHGVIASAKMQNLTQNREFGYRFSIVPELAMLKYSAQNQVYGTDGDVTAVDIIEAELRDANKAGSNTASSRVPRSIEYAMMPVSDTYPKLDFVMQYRESDLNFICRLCEKFGIFFSFDHTGSREKVIFGDRREHFRKLAGRNLDETLPFRSNAQALGEGGFAIRSFNAEYAVQSGTVALREYNEETPKVNLAVSDNTSFAGQGVRTDYGENYRTASEGAFLAKRRVECLEAQRLKFRGMSNIPSIRPGLFFRLVDHPDNTVDGLYLITEVHHRITEPAPFGFGTSGKVTEPYENSFVCVPFDVGYRPPLKTPRPVVHGLLTAFIDGGSDGTSAQLDSYGRYKVRIQDEESALSNGRASHFLRKAEPYGGGDGCGSHSTLVNGTEVTLAFIHGDPDRPIIMGAVSNGEQSNPVTGRNQNVSHRTKTSSGVVFQIGGGS